MRQSKLQSLCESFVNVMIGGLISIVSQMLLFPYIGIDISLAMNVVIWLYFMSISVVRGYVVRRYFDKKLTEK